MTSNRRLSRGWRCWWGCLSKCHGVLPSPSEDVRQSTLGATQTCRHHTRCTSYCSFYLHLMLIKRTIGIVAEVDDNALLSHSSDCAFATITVPTRCHNEHKCSWCWT